MSTFDAGDAFEARVIYKLHDGEIIEIPRHVIVWDEEVVAEDRRTGADVLRVLVTYAVRRDDADVFGPYGRPFEVIVRPGEWVAAKGHREDVAVRDVTTYPRGQLGERAGRYVARDKGSNSLALMVESYVRQVESSR